MSRCVLDASAILAVLFDEAGGQAVYSYLEGARVSAVNLSEVLARMLARDIPLEQCQYQLTRLAFEVVPFDAAQAAVCASLRAKTKAMGLSLGDRACLTLGLETGSPVVTAERAWDGFDAGVKVIRIR